MSMSVFYEGASLSQQGISRSLPQIFGENWTTQMLYATLAQVVADVGTSQTVQTVEFAYQNVLRPTKFFGVNSFH